VAVAGINVVDYLLVGATVAMVVSRFSSGRAIYVDVWMVLPFAAALLVAAWSVVIAGEASGGSEMLLRILLSTALIAVLITASAADEGEQALGAIIRWWVAGVGVCAAGAIVVEAGLVSFVGVLEQPTGDRLSGLSSHPNSLAFSIVMAIPAATYLAQRATGFWRTSWWLAILGTFVWGLFLTGSRSGLLVGAPLLALAVVLVVRSSRLRIMTVPIVILSVVLGFLYLPAVLGDTRLVQGAAQSDSGRILINDSALATFSNNPILGGGFSAQSGVAVPLMVLSAGGLALAVAYYAFVFRALPVLWRSRSERIAQVGILSLAGFLCFGLLNPVFAERATFWPILACALLVLLKSGYTAPANPWRTRPT